MSSITQQESWSQYEKFHKINEDVVKIADFLNKFEYSVRIRLAALVERLDRLERHVGHLEEQHSTSSAATHSSSSS